MMFDAVEAFKKQFTSVEGGYIIYPSRNSGGKFVTAEEYASLVAEWDKIGRNISWKLTAIIIGSYALWVILLEKFALPTWTSAAIMWTIVGGISARLFWAARAPHRLVKDRPAVTSPRPASNARREARSMLNWPTIFLALLISGGIFFNAINSPELTVANWAWLVGSGLFLCVYAWIAFRKIMDR